MPAQLHPELAALLRDRAGCSPHRPARSGLDRARSRFSELLAAGLAGALAVALSPACDEALAQLLTRAAGLLHGGGP